jgi:hypothetical protein
MPRAPLLLALALFSLFAPTSVAHATVLRRASLDEMTHRATLVFYGTVRESFCHRGHGDQAGLFTTTTLDVHHLLKGNAAEVPARGFRLTQVGGALDGVVARIPGQPRFVPGQRVVLFLERTPRGFAVLGFEQGRFVVEDEPDGSPVAVRRLGGAAVVDPGTGALDEGSADDLRLPLPVLFQQVRALVDAEVAR